MSIKISSNSSSYIIICLYLFTLFVPRFGSFDFSVTQWLYVSVLNCLVTVYFVVNRNFFLTINVNKRTLGFFGLLLLIILISILSITQSVNIDASIIYLARLFSFSFAILLLYLALKSLDKFSFYSISLLVTLVLSIEALEVLYHFLKQTDRLRSSELLQEIPHRYGNRNIVATAIAMKLPFLLFVLQHSKNYIKYLAYLVVFIVVADILLIGARSAALITALILIGYSLYVLTTVKKKQWQMVGLLFIVTCMSFGLSISINNIYKDRLNSTTELFFTKKEKDLYNPKADVNLIDGSGRGAIWESAIDDFKSSPIIGVGIGNWRHVSKLHLYPKNRNEKLLVHTHVHNDFLQALAETGIIGFLLYISLYILALVLLFKVYQSTEDKSIPIVLGLALMAYAIDAFFNFPHNRAPIQIVFAILLALIIGYYGLKDKMPSKNKKINTLFYGLILPVSLGVMVVSVKDFESSIVNFMLITEIQNNDAFTGHFKRNYEEVNNILPDFPYVNNIGMTTDDIKSLYAFNKNLDERGLEHLNRSMRKTQNNLWPQMLKGVYYSKRNNKDSALYYAKKVFDLSPSIDVNFRTLRNLYIENKDTTALFEVYDKHFAVRPNNILGWLNMTNDIRTYYLDDSLALKKVDDIQKRYPYNESIKKYREDLVKLMSRPLNNSSTLIKKYGKETVDKLNESYTEGIKLYNEKKFSKARLRYLEILSLDPENLQVAFKLGQLETAVKNYNKAIDYFTKVIDGKYLDNGRPEHNRGFAYFKLNDFENAKKDFLVSREKGWGEALKIDDAFFK